MPTSCRTGCCAPAPADGHSRHTSAATTNATSDAAPVLTPADGEADSSESGTSTPDPLTVAGVGLAAAAAAALAAGAGGTGTDDGDFFLMGYRKRVSLKAYITKIPIGSQTLEGAYRYRLVKFSPPAFVFAGMNADATAYCRKRIAFTNDLDGFFIITFGNGGHIIGYINACRAGMLAGGYDHGIAHGPGTAMFLNMVFEFLEKVF